MIEEPDSMNQVGRNNIVLNITIEKTKEQLIKEIKDKAEDLEYLFACSLSHYIASDIFVGGEEIYYQFFKSTEYYQKFIDFACLAKSKEIAKDKLKSKLLIMVYEELFESQNEKEREKVKSPA